jgi:uncharacterized protein GlcG (DUF336 family)
MAEAGSSPDGAQMIGLTLNVANQLAEAALEKGRELALKPLTVAVLDAGGHLVALQRQDGASTLRPQIASGKAFTALAMGMSSRRLGEIAAERPSFVASLGAVAPAGVIPAAGGVLIATQEGGLIGAIGITGDTSDNDEACALAAISCVRLLAIT